VHAEKITPEELEVDWNKPAIDIVRTVRVGGAHTFFRGSRVKLHQVVLADDSGDVGCVLSTGGGVVVGAGAGAIRIVTVQPEGKKPMAARDWANGVRPSVGESFGAH
jgi:methionyl-tRNA formyltransferase